MSERLTSQEMEERMEQMMQRMQALEEEVRVLQDRLDYHTGRTIQRL